MRVKIIVDDLLPCKKKRRKRPSVRFTVQGPHSVIFNQERGVLVFQILDTDADKKINVTFESAKGNPARVDGVPTWAVSDAAILTVTPAADGLSAIIAAVGPVGICQVQLTADADLGAGVRPINGLLDVEVIASEAVRAVLTPT